jgi:hypothetical protein
MPFDSMIALYAFCFVPLAAWFALWLLRREIHPIELLASTAFSFILAGIVHTVSFKSQTGDYEFWSGQVESVKCFSAWTEEYEEAVYRTESYTDAQGLTQTKEVFDHWRTCVDYHPRYNTVYTNIGDWRITDSKYSELIKEFGKQTSVRGGRSTMRHSSHMIAGDRNDYVSVNIQKPLIPVTSRRYFINRLKAKPSIWSKVEPPAELNIPDRPRNDNPFHSDRLVGVASKYFSIKALDNLNAVLGPSKKIDLNIIGFDSSNTELSQYVESKWQGGNKNGLYITFGENWCRVFGWSKSDICKRNIESLFLLYPKNDALLEKIKAEIETNYERPNWHDFDHIQIEPSGWAWFWFAFFMIGGQVGIFLWAFLNDIDKDDRIFK